MNLKLETHLRRDSFRLASEQLSDVQSRLNGASRTRRPQTTTRTGTIPYPGTRNLSRGLGDGVR